MTENKIESNTAVMASLYRLIMIVSVIALLGAALLWQFAPTATTAQIASLLVRSYLFLIPAALGIFAVLMLWRRQAVIGGTAAALVGLWLLFQILG